MPQHIPDEILYDVRLVERHIVRGLITREQWEKFRSQSTDVGENSEALDLDQLGGNRTVKRPIA